MKHRLPPEQVEIEGMRAKLAQARSKLMGCER